MKVRATLYKTIKRFFDIIFSSILILLLLPLFFIVIVMIKVNSRGPAFYSQIRIGKDGKPIKVFKFRTMYVNPDEKLHQQFLKKLLNGELGPEKGGYYSKLQTDPRVTRIGRFLRRTYIDELPQIVNVLKGDMSLVGPRAALPWEVGHYEDWQKERLECKPGIAGPWLAYGGYIRDQDQLIKMDINYKRSQSFVLDFKILLMTFIRSLFGGRGAY